jgi:bifunctional non-homologous end joining protein LigD
VRAERPAAIVPMQAEIGQQIPRGEDWLFEVKWDGVRAIAFLDGEEVRLQSRSGLRCERQYPELAVIHHYVAGRQAILDGEIAVLDEKGVSRFHLIQPRIHNTDPNSIAHLVRSTPVVYFVFDILYLDGWDLRQTALRDRKRLLAEVLTTAQEVRISEHFAGVGQEMFDAAREAGLEGIVGKHAGSRYESRRSREWLKLKVIHDEDFPICGFTEGERQHFGALVLGIERDGALEWAGNVGTGFDERAMRDLRARLDPLVTAEAPFAQKPPLQHVTWVRPELVCKVKFSNWTPDERLRAPVYLGLRDDAAPRGGRREKPEVAFSNLTKIFYPDEGYTKGDVIAYYDSVADLILPHLKDRPLSLKRYPNGIRSEYFFQKNSPESFPSWLRMEDIEGTRFVFAEDRESLLYLVNLGCIDHNPWMSRVPTLDHPDWVLIDLDPQECGFDLIVEAALLVKEKLDAIGMTGYPKTTGGDGMHVYIPVEPVYSYEESRTFAELLSHLVMGERRELFTTPRSVAKRQKNRVYFDYLQNGRSKTIAAPYVLRAYAGAPVATPLEWREVKAGLRPAQFDITNAPDRFARTGDLFAGVLRKPQRLEDAIARLEPLLRG